MRLAASILAAMLASLGLTAVVPATPLGVACAGAGSNHATVVVEHGNGTVVQRCVAFDGESISGEQLLASSGIEYQTQTQSLGVAICQVDGEPAGYTECPGRSDYWSFWTWTGRGPWTYSRVGVSLVTLHDGDAEGFRYVPSASPAPPVSPDPCPAPPAPTPAPATPTRPAPTPVAPTSAAKTPAAQPTRAAPTDAPPRTSATAAPSPSVTPPLPRESGGSGIAAASPASGGSAATASSSGSDGGLVVAGLGAGALAALVVGRAVRRRRARR